MAKMTLGQKANRVLRLLIGLRQPRIAAALAAHGFDEAELRLGYDLLRQLSQGRLALVEPDPIAKPVDALDAWENKWYPIIQAVLGAHFPEARDAVFLNIAQTSGPEVIVTVTTLLDRLDSQPEEVREILKKRGLTAEAIGEARGILRSIEHLQSAVDEITANLEADAAAEKALWDWYLQWSTIVRTVVKSRRLLRALGFRRTPSGEVVEAPIENDDDMIDDVVDDGTEEVDPSVTPGEDGTPAPLG
ncbi:MAG: hypothetical protein AB7S26_35755 [Sandaracinaceae bacterium]